jgi:4-amino-4-deoxy-L-arabinose transferase-like glycosyltransferase
MTGARARWFLTGILLVILLAFGLRMLAIDRQDIWGDEAFSIWLSSQPLSQVVAGGADTHPPLYPLLLSLWMRVVGSTPLAVRSLSAYIGTLTVPVVYVLGRRVFGRMTGGLAALLAAVSPVLVYYSQETRMYGLVTLLTAASVYWALRTWRVGRDGISPYMAYSLFAIAAAYTHYYAFFALVAVNLVAIPRLLRGPRTRLGRWLGAQGALVAAYVPWIVVQSSFLGGKASARFGEWDLPAILRIAGETFRAYGAGLGVPAGVGWLITVPFLLALGAGLLFLSRLRSSSCEWSGAWMVIAYLTVPLVLAWIVNPIMPFFYARYLLLAAPAFYVLAAWGVSSLGGTWWPLVAVGALLLAGSLYGLFGYYTDDAFAKGQYGQMMAYVEAHARPGDGLLLANPLQRPIFAYYRPAGLEAYVFPRYEYPLEDPRTAQDLEAIASRHARLWLVRFGNPAEYDPEGTLTRWLATHGSKAYAGGWIDADLSLYVMAPAAEGEGIQHPLRVDLGEQVRLLGYDLSAGEVSPGDTLLLTLYWQALSPMAERYTVFTHLLDAEQAIQAQVDSEPQGGALPTDRWDVGQIVQDNYALVVSPDALPGPHTLEVGMYLLRTLDRLPVRDPDSGAVLGDRVVLGSVEVVAP